MLDLTSNQRRAYITLLILVLKRAVSVDSDDLPQEFYEVEARDLFNEGWSMPEARGTLGALIEKGIVDKTDEGTYLTPYAYELAGVLFEVTGPPV